MKEEQEIKQIVAKNIVAYRKVNNLTQLELAERLNYSDKAISKWERGESLPDVYILLQIAEMFGITLNDLVTPQTDVSKAPSKKLNKTVVTWISVGLAWLVGFVVYVILQMISIPRATLTFSYTLVVSIIVLVVFTSIYKNKFMRFISISGLYYSIPFAICLQLEWKYNCAFLFLIAIPLQVLTVLWYLRKFNND